MNIRKKVGSETWAVEPPWGKTRSGRVFEEAKINFKTIKLTTMFFGIILSRIVFIACMVFILGYVFGNFSKSRTLTRITKIASILAIALFMVGNIFLLRSGGWRHGNYNLGNHCAISQQDSSIAR